MGLMTHLQHPSQKTHFGDKFAFHVTQCIWKAVLLLHGYLITYPLVTSFR